MGGRIEQADIDLFVAAVVDDAVRFASSLTGSTHDGWDLTQDALARLVVALDRIDLDGSPRAYLYKTIVRLNLNRLRRAGREGAAMVRVARTMASAEPGSEIDLPDWLAAALRSLSPRQRTALALVHIWGFSIDEASELMNCRRNTVKTHLSRAMSQLRTAAP